MLSNNIKIDLHIHSDSSSYKEPEGLVKDSTLENVDVLLDKLLKNDVQLFSITDHNRFNSKLYIGIKNKLKEVKYKSLNILAGIEFDVRFEEGMSNAHVITIFNCIKEDDYIKVANELNKKLLKKDEYYSRNDFEQLLKNIGLDTLLIVHQKKDINNNNGKHQSLSDSTTTPFRIIEMGYISALEFQKSHVEGILIKNLKTVNKSFSLITGSDCHDWNYYPARDKTKVGDPFEHTVIKSLPTFKGLHLALTSPTTRIGRFNHNINKKFISGFFINDSFIELDKGINVIIGENGSGKSSIIKFLSSNSDATHIKQLIKENNLTLPTEISQSKIKSIYQSEIINEYNNNKLLKGDNTPFKEVNISNFKQRMSNYSNELLKYIEGNINEYLAIEKLRSIEITLKQNNHTLYYVDISKFSCDYSNTPHLDRRTSLKNILIDLLVEHKHSYYKENNDYNAILKTVINNTILLYNEILKDSVSEKNTIDIMSIIDENINTYNRKTKSLSTTLDKEIKSYLHNKNIFISSIVSACTEVSKNKKYPDFPQKNGENDGVASINKGGFNFITQAKYCNADIESEYQKNMFVSSFSTKESICKINSKELFRNAVRNATDINHITTMWNANCVKFISNMCESSTYIENMKIGERIGSTMGEISIVYYKYHFTENDEWDIIIIDQPEDNISNAKLSSELIEYINGLRDNKQIILATHNPLLVVNLDVDNVIYLEKNNNNISCASGCLEDEENSILEHIAKHMEGGKEMIEKRLKIYG